MPKVLSHMESKKNIRPPLSQVQIPLLESEIATEERKAPKSLERKRRWKNKTPQPRAGIRKNLQ
jgi:hypothetical protein